MSYTAAEVYALARGAGLDHQHAITATAIAWAESGLNPSAVGDVALETGTWGPSVGLWQIRSLKAEQGTGGTRDASRLTDPRFNARSMFSVSNGGRNFGPWSTFVDGAYAGHVAAVRRAVGDGSQIPAAPAGGSSGVQAAAYTASPAGWSIGGINDLVVQGVALAGGCVLVLVGVSSLFKLRQKAEASGAGGILAGAGA